MTDMLKRGAYAHSTAAKMEAFLGRPSSCAELRLLPYIQYVMVNDHAIDPRKVNGEERNILSLLRQAGHIEGGMSGLRIAREFWDFMCDVLFDEYVAGTPELG